MVAARKAESGMEDTKERVRALSSAATEVSDGSRQLGDQIARLMAALNRAEQGTYPASAPNSPRHRGCGRGWTDRNTPVYPSSHNGLTGLGQNTPTCSSSAASRVATALQSRGSTQVSTGQCPKHKVPQHPTMFQMPGLGSYGKGVCNTIKTVKEGWGELRECGQTPYIMQSVNLQHSLPDPNSKPTHMKAAKRKGWQQVTPILFLNPDPIACLIGCSNEAPMIIDGQEVAALIDLGVQVFLA